MPPDQDPTKPIAEFLDSEGDGEKYQRFGKWLAEDRTHVSAFVDHLEVEEDLRRLALHDDVSRYVDTTMQKPTPARLARSAWARRGLAVFAVAGSVLFAVVMLSVSRQPKNDIAKQPAAPAGAPAIVATIGDANDCRWEAKQYAVGQHLKSGSALSLLSGVAQLTFETGAVLILQGPCQLDVSENAIALDRGRISAVVPPSASGFAVMTPSSEVVDIGTKFGVRVDEEEGTEVHVFSGEVVTRARNDQGEIVGEPMFVTTQNAIHFRPGTDDAERFRADEEAFVRWLADSTDPLAEATPPVEGRLALWLSGGRWIVDGERRVQVWRDTVASHSRMPNNALQQKPSARPLVVNDAIGGWPALRFDGKDDCLITTPITTGNNQTIAFVANLREGTHHDGQILNYNGPPQVETWDRQDPNILQIFTRIDEEGRARLNPMVFLGFTNHQVLRVGEAGTGEGMSPDFGTPLIDEPFVAIYLYDHDADHAELWVNNRSIGQSSAPASIGITSRRVIGRHGGYPRHFRGDIAEVFIYDEGLDAEQIGALGSHLLKKYRIAAEP